MSKKYLDYSGLSYFWAQIKGLWVQDVNYDSSTHQITKTKGSTTGNVVGIPYKTSELTNDSGYITSADVPEGSTASTVTPVMDGTAALGTDNGFARGDHVHPTDTSRAASDHTHGYITNAGQVSNAATIGNGDYFLITDVSANGAVKRASITFDASTDTKALTQKGTWESFVPTTRTVNGEELSSDVTIYGTDIVASSTDATSITDYLTTLEDAQNDAVYRVKLNGGENIVSGGTADIPVFTGATSSAAGTVGLVPAPASATMSNVLTGDGSWKGLCAGTSYGSDYVTHKIGVGTSANVGANINAATSSTAGVMSSSDKSKLDSITMTDGIIDSSVLPSFVDDVVEAYARSNQTELGSTWLATGSASGTVITPETGKIYVLMNDSTSYSANSQFRWGGSAYVKLSDGGVSSITNSEIDTILAS